MMLINHISGPLGVASTWKLVDYQAAAARQIYNIGDSYAVVSMGPDGANINTITSATKERAADLYSEAYDSAGADGVVYIALYDKTIDDLLPIEEAPLFATSVVDNVYNKVKETTKEITKYIYTPITKYKYTPQIIGGSLLVGAAIFATYWFKKRALTAV